MINAFTVDVEDYFHVSAFSDRIDPRSWDDYPSRVVPNTQRILDLLQRAQIRGTFFILGWVARRFPDLVRQIVRDGHEIASHGYSHQLIYRQSFDQFRADVQMARDVLEQISGQKVDAYRAPSFSIVKESVWALEILCEEGYRFDSSIFPVRHDRYGLTAAQRFPFGIKCNAGILWEFPPPLFQLMGMKLPVGGGGYFRLYPFYLTVCGLRQINNTFGQPFTVYIHPWEFDPEQPRIRSTMNSRFRHYVNLCRTESRIERLLNEFQFGTLTESMHHLFNRDEKAIEQNIQVYRFDDFHQLVAGRRKVGRRAGAMRQHVAG